MTDELSEQVMDLMVTRLGTITVANGFATEIGPSKVYRGVAAREFATSELPAVTLKRLKGPTRHHLRGANEIQLRVKVRGIVAASSPDEFTALTNLMGDISKAMESNDVWNNGSTNLAERTWVEEHNMHDPSRDANLHVCSVVVVVLLRQDRSAPSSRKLV